MKKSVKVKQHDVSDCGPACLASVAAYFGIRVSISQIRQHAGTNRHGTSLLGLIEAAGFLNFEARGVNAKGISINDIPVPSIFHLFLREGIRHFVVVYKVNGERVFYMDPSIGEVISRTISDFEPAWSGVVLLLMPGKKFNKSNKQQSV